MVLCHHFFENFGRSACNGMSSPIFHRRGNGGDGRQQPVGMAALEDGYV